MHIKAQTKILNTQTVLYLYMVYADLHSHTTVSDGETNSKDIVKIANRAGLDALAITDHDRINPLLDEKLEVIDGIDVVNGIELRVTTQEDEQIDLLGYGVRTTERLIQLTERIQENRIERAEKMIDLIEDETGVRLEYKPQSNTGRPHIARAIEDNDSLEYEYEDAFETLIGNECPCYTQRESPSFQKGLSVLNDAASFVSLAHPYRYNSPRNVLKHSKQLDGVECQYPYESKGFPINIETDLAFLATEWFDLTITGGSDSHKPDTIGAEGITKKQYEMFLDASGLQAYSKLNLD